MERVITMKGMPVLQGGPNRQDFMERFLLPVEEDG
jgi:hypothetical protein